MTGVRHCRKSAQPRRQDERSGVAGTTQKILRTEDPHLGQREGVAQVQQAVHVGVGERAEKLLVWPTLPCGDSTHMAVTEPPSSALLRPWLRNALRGRPAFVDYCIFVSSVLEHVDVPACGFSSACRAAAGGCRTFRRGVLLENLGLLPFALRRLLPPQHVIAARMAALALRAQAVPGEGNPRCWRPKLSKVTELQSCLPGMAVT